MEFQYKGNENYKETLGRKTWAFLHELTNGYPEYISKELERKTALFLKLLSEIYPCKVCQTGFKKFIDTLPFKIGTKSDFQQYMCIFHNEVNKKLGKKTLECKFK